MNEFIQDIGPYTVEAEIGRGGMGVVYRATDTRLGRPVAIKALPGDFADDAERLARFEREARTLAALNHPNVAGIHGVEEHEGRQVSGPRVRRWRNAGRAARPRPAGGG